MNLVRIHVEGHIDASWVEWLGLAQLEHLPDNTTLLVGSVADQAALYGCLLKLRDGGVPLLGLEQVKSNQLNKGEKISMKKILKRVGIVLGVLIVLLIVIVGGLHFMGQSRLNNAPEVTVTAVSASTNEAAIERGEHLATISGCRECHTRNLAGQAFVNEAPIGYIPAPNLTPGGVGANYTDEDWDRAIRHGVAKDGRVMTIMASNHYAEYGDDDFANLIAYLKSVPPVENTLGPRQIQFPGTIIFGMLAYDSWAVNQIDHAAVGGRNAPPMEATAEYGEYLVSIASCGSCHAENLAGNTPDSDSPQGPNITPGGKVKGWTAEEFALAVRTGQTPEVHRLSNEMPWAQYAVMSDTEVQALWQYIQSLDPLPDN